jgi:hypothetical protein
MFERVSARLALLSAVAVAGCQGGRSLQGNRFDESHPGCLCPSARDLVLPLPVDPAGKAVSVSADSCVAWYIAKENAVVVVGRSESGPSCRIGAWWAGSFGYEAFVSFEYPGRDCGWRATGVAQPFTSQATPPVQCNGPGNLISWLPLPAETSGTVVDVTCDCCQASYDASQNSVVISTASAPVCTIVVSLADGTALSAEARYRLVAPGPCTGDGYYTNALDASAFEPVDGGAPPCSR